MRFRRNFIVMSFLLAFGAIDAHAQYPERGLTLIVPYGAGGGTDITARLLARDLEAVLGKPVTVENRAGGAAGSAGVRSLPPGRTAIRSAISTCRACMRAISIRRSAARKASTASRR